MKQLLCCSSILLFSTVLTAQPGTIDNSYGTDGKVITSISAGITSSELQKDGKLVIGGSNGQLLLLRYLENGNADQEFGNGSVVSVSFPTVTSFISGGLVLQSDGKIIVVGSGTANNQSDANFLLARFSTDGSLDSSFGENGKVERDDNKGTNSYDVAKGVALQADGKIVIVGTRQFGLTKSFVLKRYLQDGNLDNSFGNNGAVTTEFDIQDEATSIVCQPDGKIIAGGKAGNLNSNQKFALARYLDNGNLDQSFGVDGKVITDFSLKGENLNALALQDDGKIIAAGMSNIDLFTKYSFMAAARYNSNGGLDTEFGVQGKATIQFIEGSAEANHIVVQRNKKIILTGRYFDLNQRNDFACARLTTDGDIDSSFGKAGTTITDLGSQDYSNTSVLQKDGKIILAGNQSNDEGNQIALVRYFGDPVNQLGPIAKKIRRWIRNHTLNWQDLDNSDVSYYSVSQSNGVSGFKEIARIKAGKNDTYSYNLSNTASNDQTNTYRITAVSHDGSNLISETIRDDNSLSINVSPNPVKDVLKISGLPANKKTVINIDNRNGNALQSATAQSSCYNMNVSQLKSGVYNVVVTINNKTQSIKFVKE